MNAPPAPGWSSYVGADGGVGGGDDTTDAGQLSSDGRAGPWSVQTRSAAHFPLRKRSQNHMAREAKSRPMASQTPKIPSPRTIART